MRGRDGGEPRDGRWICRRLIYDPSEWEIEEQEAISRKTEKLDRVVAAGTIKEIDREHVKFIVRRIVYPPKRPDNPLAVEWLSERSVAGIYPWIRIHSLPR